MEKVYNPFGEDTSLSMTFTINGEVPDARICREEGIRGVFLVFVHEGQEWDFFEAGAPCSYGQLDTRPDRVLRAGRHHAFAVAEMGTGRYRTYTFLVDAVRGHINLPPADFDTMPGLPDAGP